MTPPLRFPRGLYGVTPDWTDANRLEQAIRAAADGGMSAVQLRVKPASTQERRELAQHLLPVCRSLNIALIINDDWQLAAEIGADGVHLGKDDADPDHVRKQLPASMLLGASCYGDLERARQMLATGVDYIAFGAMFSSATKPQAPSAPLSVLTDARELVKTITPRPAVVAIGGITAGNVARVVSAGADSVAVVGGLFLATDVKQAARDFAALF